MTSFLLETDGGFSAKRDSFSFSSSSPVNSSGGSLPQTNTRPYSGEVKSSSFEIALFFGFFASIFMFITWVWFFFSGPNEHITKAETSVYEDAPKEKDIPKENPSLARAQDFESALVRLKQADPRFSRRLFLDKANTIFYLVQDAQTKRNPDFCRPFVSDGIYQRYRIQAERYREDGNIAVLKDIMIIGSQIVKVESEGGYDSISVRIHAELINYILNERTKAVVSGDPATLMEFVEYWVFTRKAGVKTSGGGIVKEKKCPNCGAPLEINQAGRCHYCKASITSGEFDWVLTEIIQEGEWQG